MNRSISSSNSNGLRNVPLFALATLIVTVLLIPAILVVEDLRFVVVSARAKVGIEIILSLASLFGAMVLILFPGEGARQRLRWVAVGFILIGLGGLLYGYLYPLLVAEPNLNVTMYGGIAVRGLAAACLVVGIYPRVTLPLSTAWIVLSLVVGTTIFLIVIQAANALPPLIQFDNSNDVLASGNTIMHGLTPWYWPIAVIPLALSLIAFGGAMRDYSQHSYGPWLLLAMGFLGGAEFHTFFWPSAYSSILTTSSILRFALMLTLVSGGIVELRRIARERAATLEVERLAAQRARELVVLKSDLSRMIAHELSSPLAAIRRFAEMTATEPLTTLQSQAVDGMHVHVDMLIALIDDIRAVATIEQEDFLIRLQTVPLTNLLQNTISFAQTLPGQHPVIATAEIPETTVVAADPERISQVMRNLLTNAAKYSPDGTPIEIRLDNDDDEVRISVVDRGYGIEPGDLERIFEKFERGGSQASRSAAGLGIGLYLAYRIIQGHGSVLNVYSTPSQGSTFTFTLKREGQGIGL